MCLSAICMSSMKKCPFKSSVFYLIRLCFLLLSCMSHLCILEIKPLPGTLFVNVFSHSIGCLVCGFLCCAKVSKFDYIHLFLFLLL